MLPIVVLAVVFVAYAAGWLLHRYAARIPASRAVPVAIVAAFAAGYVLAPVVQRRYAQAQTPAAVSPAGTRTALTSDEIARLSVVSAKTTGYVDGFVHGNATHFEKTGTFSRNETGRIGGWIVDASNDPATAVVAIVDGKTRIDETASYGVSRPDVAAFLKNDRAANVGFSIALPLRALAQGRHEVTIGEVDADGVTLHTLEPVAFTVR